MKNKKAEQIEAKRRHKEFLKSKRREEPDLQRSEPYLTEKPTFLIVCEGKNTEPSYFSKFRLSSATIKTVGEGFNTVTLVERAFIISQEKSYDQVWCVFDKDDFPPEDFNTAIQMAESGGMHVAYSNQAFEYWIILHFNDHQGGGMHRNTYHGILNGLLRRFNVGYDGLGSKIITEELFEVMDGIDEQTNLERKILAIRRARRNCEHFDGSNPANEESSSTVFKIVEELIRYL